MSETNHEPNTIIRLIGVLWRGKWIIIFCGLFIGALMFVATFFMPRIYSSESTVILPKPHLDQAQMLAGLTGGMSMGGLFASSIDVELEIMNSPSVLEEVVVEYGLLADMTMIPLNGDKTPYLTSFQANETASGNTYYIKFTSPDGDFIFYDENGRYKGSGRNFARFHGAGFSFVMTCNSPEVGETFKLDIFSSQGAALTLQEQVSINAASVETVRVSAEATTPVMAQNIVTAIVNKYIETTELHRSGTAGRLRSFLENQLNETRAKLEAASWALAEYSARELVYKPSLEIEALASSLQYLETQRMMAKVQRQIAERMLEMGRYSATAAAPTTLSGVAGTYDVATSNLESHVDQLRLELSRLLTRYQENHPLVLEKRQALEQAERELSEKKEQKLESELEIYRTQERGVLREIERLEGILRRQPSKYIEYTRLQMEISALTEIYRFITAQYEQARIDEQRTLGNRGVPRILNEATYESKPVRPRRLVYTAIAGFLGGIIGISIVLSRYYIRSNRLIERVKAQAVDDKSESRRARRERRRRG